MIQTFGGNTHLLNALDSNGVEFIIVGGVAVHHYIPSRVYKDLDIMINPTVDNAQKLINALTKMRLPFPHAAEDIAKPKTQIPLKLWHDADILTPEAEVNFEKLIAESERDVVNGVNVLIVSKEALISMKKTDRLQDISDVQLLT